MKLENASPSGFLYFKFPIIQQEPKYMRKIIISIYFILNSMPLFSQTSETPPVPVVIYGEIHSPFEYKELEAQLFENFLWYNPTKLEHISTTIPLRNPTMVQRNPKSTYFRWVSPPIHSPGYLTLKSDSHYLMQDFLVSPGDSVMIFFDDFTKNIFFSGKSAGAYEFQAKQTRKSKLEQFESGLIINNPNPEEFIKKGRFSALLEEFGSQYGRSFEVIPYDPFLQIKKLRQRIRELENHLIQDFDTSELNIDKYILDIIKGNYLGLDLYKIYNQFRFAYNSAASSNNSIVLDSLSQFYKKELPHPKSFDFPENSLYHGSQLHIAVIEFGLISARIENIPIRKWIKQNFIGPEKDKLLGYYLIRYSSEIQNPEKEFAAELPFIETPWISSLLEDYVNKTQHSASLAPLEFSTPENKKSNLSSVAWDGKLLFLDFWFTGCGACVIFYRDILSQLEEEFGHQVSFVSISTDKDSELWTNSLKSGKYTSDKAINFYAGPDHEILRIFQVSTFPRQILLGPDLKLIQSGGFPSTLEEWRTLLKMNLDSLDKTE
ncbi:TlpA family protein disulfide reductase [Cecembia rubra]|nr:thioredoxin family protein [Cecembia rubra]